MLKVASLGIFLLSISVALNAQTFSYEPQFKRLMSEPKEIVSALVIYPWRDGNPASLNGLNETPHGSTIRIVSAERPISDYRHWLHWSGQDGATWVDIVDFP